MTPFTPRMLRLRAPAHEPDGEHAPRAQPRARTYPAAFGSYGCGATKTSVASKPAIVTISRIARDLTHAVFPVRVGFARKQ